MTGPIKSAGFFLTVTTMPPMVGTARSTSTVGNVQILNTILATA